MHRSLPGAIFAMALTGLARPSVAQDAAACVDEVQRLSEAFPIAGEAQAAVSGGQPAPGAAAQPATRPMEQEPGARKGSALGEEQRRQISDLVRQARAAGERGDGEGCIQGLSEARVMLRQAGFGSTLPGSAADARGPTGSGGSSVTPAAPATAGSTATAPGGADAGRTGVGVGNRGGMTSGATGSPAARGRTGDGSPGATSGGSAGTTAGGNAAGGAGGGGGGGGTR